MFLSNKKANFIKNSLKLPSALRRPDLIGLEGHFNAICINECECVILVSLKSYQHPKTLQSSKTHIQPKKILSHNTL